MGMVAKLLGLPVMEPPVLLGEVLKVELSASVPTEVLQLAIVLVVVAAS